MLIQYTETYFSCVHKTGKVALSTLSSTVIDRLSLEATFKTGELKLNVEIKTILQNNKNGVMATATFSLPFLQNTR